MYKFIEARKFAETNRYSYYIQNDGIVYRIYTTLYDPCKGYPKDKRIYVKGTLNNDGHLRVRIGSTATYLVKNIMAKIYIRGYDPNKHVVYLKDKNPYNCALDNIKLVDKIKHCRYVAKKYNARRIRVSVTNPRGETTVYESLIAAANSIPISYWCFRRYLKGYGSKVLSEYKIKVLKEEE